MSLSSDVNEMNFSFAECLGCEDRDQINHAQNFDQVSVADDGSAVSGDISARRVPSESEPSDPGYIKNPAATDGLRATAGRSSGDMEDFDDALGRRGMTSMSMESMDSVDAMDSIEYSPSMASLPAGGKSSDNVKKPRRSRSMRKSLRRLKTVSPKVSAKCCYAPLQDGLMDEKELMKTTWWICYCCCCGTGCGLRNQLRFKYRCVLCDGQCMSADCLEEKDGVCNCVSNCCGCYLLSQLPFRDQTPRCIICDIFLCGMFKRGREDTHSEASEVYDNMIHNAFNPLYCFCCGFAVVAPEFELDMSCKCCCCRASFQNVTPADGDVCMYLASCWTWHNQCRLPPNCDYTNPICATCGKRLRRKRHRKKAEEEKKKEEAKAQQAPTQERMYGVSDYAPDEVTLAEIPEFE